MNNLFSAFFRRKKSTRPFKDYYADWLDTLRSSLLPLLRRSMSSAAFSPHLLSTNVELLYTHFQSYYNSLDLAASQDVSQVIYPDWRNSLEKPFLWIGDFHPYIFTNLLRSFLGDRDDEIEDQKDGEIDFFDRPWSMVMAWKNPSRTLMNRIEQIECGLRLIAPALVARARAAQSGVVGKVAVEWTGCGGREEAQEVGRAAMEATEELTSVFLDANRLRRSVLMEIIDAIDVYQAALFLEGIAEFVTGFIDSELLDEFDHCKLPPN